MIPPWQACAARAAARPRRCTTTPIEPGASLVDGLQRALDEAIARLPVPKLMQYQLADGWTSVGFVRPVHGVVALHGADVVPVVALGLTAGRQTHGHRFEATTDPVVLQHADHYAAQLAEQGAVIADFEHRRSDILRQLRAAAAPLGLTPIDDPALLDEVTALVERPNVLLCSFEAEFLAVPQECLILTMKANQKYFPLLETDGRLTNQFLVVSNISPADPSRVIEGNERVVRPRLADAKFFFDQDRKRSLADRAAGARQGGLPRQARQPGRARAAGLRHRPCDRRAARRCGAGEPGRAGGAARQGRPADRHGGRVSRAAGHHGRLLRAPRRPVRRDRVRHRGSLQAALRRRCAATQPHRHRRCAGRQARDARGPVRHRPDTHRRQGSRSRCAAMPWA